MTKAKVVTVALLALFVLALLCAQRSGRTAASATGGAAAGSAKLTLAVEDGKMVLRGGVPDATLKQQLVAKAYQVFGAGSVVNQLTIEPNAKSEDWLPRAGELIVRMKTWGNGSVTFEGPKAMLGGEVRTEAEKMKRQEELVALLGSSANVDGQLQVAALPAKRSSMVAKVQEAMAGKTIEFEIGSATLTPRSMKLLDTLVPILQSEKDTRVEIGGHTDNYGDPKFNQMVSQARAVAVAQYLVGKGIDGRRLASKGYGDSKPIATNKTKSGRQQNRRVTFQAL